MTRQSDKKQGLRIAELEKELEIEAALERVRTVAMGMIQSEDLLGICETMFHELKKLGFEDLRNAMISIHYDEKQYLLNYEYRESVGKTVIKVMYNSHPIVNNLVDHAKQSSEGFTEQVYAGEALDEWRAFRMGNGEADDPRLYNVSALYYYFYSIRTGAVGISMFSAANPGQLEVLKRFRNVFDLAYKRYIDITNAGAQARDAQVELALERVRARTMAMQHSDELAETAYILFQQFRDLGENPDQATIGIINEAEGVIEYWVTIHGNQTSRVYKFPVDEPNVSHKIYKAWKKHEKSLVIDLSGKALHDFSKFRESMGGAGYNPEEKRRIINVAFFSKGLINVQSTVERSVESLQLLERFANVFESTYIRFLDLKNAEAQAREAQIELGLERVRARAMAMRDSEEISGVVSTVFDELTKLDFALTRCAIVIADADSSGRMIWMANSEAGQPPISFYRKSLDHPYPIATNDEWEKKNPKWVYHLKGVEKKAMDDYYANSEEVAHMPSVIRQAMDTPESIILSHSFNNFGYLRADSLEYLSEANLDILYRFAKVFDLGYTRFTDIKQAEAQAREAQIELALERVRAKTMAMQHSNELLETSQVVFQQLRDLGETADQIGIAIVKEDEGVFDLFATLYGTQMVRVFQPKIDDHFIMGRVYKNWKAHKKSFVVELGGEELQRYNILRNQLGGQNYYNENIGPDDRWIVSCASFSKGILSFSSSIEPTREAAQLLERFAQVFEQTYTRFLDLKKAEAQAREAEIELGLERVRARTMAMQKSDELQEIIKVVYEQLVHLNILVEHAGFIMDYNTRDDMHIWLADKHYAPTEITVPYFDSPHWNGFNEAKQKGSNFFAIYSGFEEKNRFYQDLFKLIPGVTDETKEYYLSCPGLAISTVLLENVGLYIENFSGTPYTDYENSTLTRFGKVFQQTYTRFLDLKHAEEQAREAQIQLALERLRARTMAMQKSDELAETVSLLFKQLLGLGIRSEQIRTCGIVTFDDKKPVGEQWITETNGEIIHKSFMVPYDEAPAYKAIYKAWKHGEQFMVIHLEGKKLKEHLGYLAKGTKVPTRDVVLPQQAKEIFNHVMFFSQGCLFIITKEALPEYHEVFKRFGAVFQQSYTRFLDLQKAEEQAREAQIETALERVRSRTMGMQYSDELREVIQLIFEQLKQLNFNIDSANFALDYKESDDFNLWLSSAGQSYPTKVHTPYLDLPIFNRFIEAKKNGVDFLTENYSFEEKNAFFDHFFKNVQGVTDERKEFVMNTAGYARSTVLMKKVTLSMQNYAAIPYSEEENAALRRFGKVFEQTYTRFLDLQQAEAQAREAKIEAGLERVRAKAMSMQTSEELNELIGTVFSELTKLDFVLTRCLIMIFDPETSSSRWWMANSEAPAEPMNYGVQYHKHPAYAAYLKAWKERILKWRYDLKGKIKKTWDDFLFVDTELAQLPKPVIEGMKAPERVILSASFNNFGCLTLVSLEPLSDEHFDLLLRFAKVFDMSYTRFNDLKQAEAQAREAKIQLALERVRARTMAMQQSGELAETASVLFQQLLNLGIRSERTIIGIPNEDTRKIEFWGTEQGGNQINTRFEYEADATYAFREIYKAWQEKRSELTVILKGKNLEEHVNYARNVLRMPLLVGLVQKQRILYNAFFSKGWLGIVTPDTQSKETLDILQRFAGVFDGTYTRFLDLQKAEAQAREARIEAGLERVRARAMAMHSSADLAEAVGVFYHELGLLSVTPRRCGLGLIDKETRLVELSTMNTIDQGNSIEIIGKLKLAGHPVLEGIYDNWLRQEEYHPVLRGNDIKAYYQVIQAQISYPDYPDDAVQYGYYFFFRDGGIFAWTETELPEAEVQIYRRFNSVIRLTYRRYKDIIEAEAQAREAQIEASLERVRGKAMAMRNSGDLSAAASTVFTELRNLGINPIRSGVGLLSKDTPKAKLYSNTSSSAAGHLSLMGEIDLSRHPVFEQQYQAWLKQENYFVALGGKELTAYYRILSAGLNADLAIAVKKNQKEYGHWFMFSEGFLYAWSDKEYTDAEMKILERFKNVIELTFRRYIELQKSEAQARDAVRQASLDRVRAEIASMRTISDLDRITPLIWNELTILGVPFIRCGVFIMDEPLQLIHTYLSTPEGKAIAAFQLHFNDDTGNGVNQTALAGWRNKQVVTLHWTEEEFRAFSHNLVEQGEIASEEGYLTERPPTGLDLHFFPFLQGMLYAGNTEPLSDDDKDLVQSLADAFSTAYARYEDFNRLELAKQEVERTLTDLKAAQTRLIQSEKMASLGELTAGIAHEIQNPLNFVNNFSEVNRELLQELKAESEKPKAERDAELEIELINDLIGNEEKINHHGKRADGIVKGMLQHSRTAGGEKLPTNINSVAEEYMRLSYHGLRAKDKGFNAEMVMHFDPDLPKVLAVGQDIGRVMLNLFNNAFYAVNLKKKTASTSYNPEVSVMTSAEDGQIIITVKDNGVGMPDHVKEKIMQPFFTTKPTGEGTGLGLSLTYDMVVKGHGGTIEINTKEGEGSEFIVTLPLN